MIQGIPPRDHIRRGGILDVEVVQVEQKDMRVYSEWIGTLDGMVNELPARQRITAADAARRVVLAAWHLDYYADLGNRPKLTDAFSVMSSAMEDVTAAYGTQQ